LRREAQNDAVLTSSTTLPRNCSSQLAAFDGVELEIVSGHAGLPLGARFGREQRPAGQRCAIVARKIRRCMAASPSGFQL